MLRITPLFTLILLSSCVTTNSNRHFAKTHNLTIQKASNINLFNGSIQIENNSGEKDKDAVYLFYNGTNLEYVSNDTRVPDNKFIYKVYPVKDSFTLLTKAAMYPRYYTVDTLLFRKDFAIHKMTYYDGSEIVNTDLRIYQFSGDTLTETTYGSRNDLRTVFQYRPEMKADLSPHLSDIQHHPNENRNSFFKKYSQ